MPRFAFRSMSPGSRAVSAALLSLVGALGAARLFAQTLQVGEDRFTLGKYSGTVASSGPDWVGLTTVTGQKIKVIADPKECNRILLAIAQDPSMKKELAVVVAGTAELDYLSRAKFVSFTGELGVKGAVIGDVKELTVVGAPTAEHPLGISGGPPSLDDKTPVSVGGASFISAKVKGFHNNSLTCIAPNEHGRMQQLKVTVADDAKVTVMTDDLTLAQVGDAIQVEGYTHSKGRQVDPNTVWAESIKITLSKPVRIKKGRPGAAPPEKSVASKTARAPKADKPADEAPDAEQASPHPAADKQAGGAAAMADKDPVGDPPPEQLIVKDSFSIDDDVPLRDRGTPRPALR